MKFNISRIEFYVQVDDIKKVNFKKVKEELDILDVEVFISEEKENTFILKSNSDIKRLDISNIICQNTKGGCIKQDSRYRYEFKNEFDRIFDELPNYTVGEVLYSFIQPLCKKYNRGSVSFLLESQDEETYTFIENARHREIGE